MGLPQVDTPNSDRGAEGRGKGGDLGSQRSAWRAPGQKDCCKRSLVGNPRQAHKSIEKRREVKLPRPLT